MEWSYYNFLIFSENSNKYYLYNCISNSQFELNRDEFLKFSSIEKGSLSINVLDNPTKSLLSKLKILTESNKMDFLKYKLQNQAKRFDKTTLALVIVLVPLNEYKSTVFDKRGDSLNKEVEKYLIDFIRKHEARKVHITWIIDSSSLISETLKRVVAQIKKLNKFVVTEIVSNGNSDMGIIHALNVSDVSKVHFTVNTENSIVNVIEFLDRLFEASPDYMSVRILLDKKNIDTGQAFYRRIEERYKEHDYTLYASFDTYIFSCMSTLCDLLYRKNFEYLIQASIAYKMKTSANFLLKKTNTYCVANYINGYVIDFKGCLYKCWRDIGSDEKMIGHLSGKGISNVDRFVEYMVNTDPFDNQECKVCRSIMICGGKCAYLKIQDGWDRKCGVDRTLETNLSKILDAKLNQ